MGVALLHRVVDQGVSKCPARWCMWSFALDRSVQNPFESFCILLHPTESLQIPSNLQFPKSSGIRSFLVAAHWHSLSGVFVVESITRPKNSEPHWGPASQRLVHFVAPWVTTANAQCHWKSGTFKGRWILSSQLFEVSLSTRDPPKFVFQKSMENSHVESTVATSKSLQLVLSCWHVELKDWSTLRSHTHVSISVCSLTKVDATSQKFQTAYSTEAYKSQHININQHNQHKSTIFFVFLTPCNTTMHFTDSASQAQGLGDELADPAGPYGEHAKFDLASFDVSLSWKHKISKLGFWKDPQEAKRESTMPRFCNFGQNKKWYQRRVKPPRNWLRYIYKLPQFQSWGDPPFSRRDIPLKT